VKIKHLFAILFFITGARISADAQFSLGGGMAYRTETNGAADNFAVQARGIYAISGPWRVGADFNFYLDGLEYYSVWDLNLNGHCLFVNNDNLKVYALAGLNYISIKYDLFMPGYDFSQSEPGFNIGVGINLLFRPVTGFVEARAVLGKVDPLVLSAGVLFPLGGR